MGTSFKNLTFELQKFQRYTVMGAKICQTRGGFSVIQVSADVHVPPGPQKALFFSKKTDGVWQIFEVDFSFQLKTFIAPGKHPKG